MSYPLSPLTSSRRTALSWREVQQVEIEFIQHLLRLLEARVSAASPIFAERIAPSAIESLRRTPAPESWWMTGLRIHGAFIGHTRDLKDPDYLAFLRKVFAEIFEFLDFAYDGDPATVMAEWDRAFGSGIECGPILKLLWPEEAREALVRVEQISAEAHEEEMRRQDQMGY